MGAGAGIVVRGVCVTSVLCIFCMAGFTHTPPLINSAEDYTHCPRHALHTHTHTHRESTASIGQWYWARGGGVVVVVSL